INTNDSYGGCYMKKIIITLAAAMLYATTAFAGVGATNTDVKTMAGSLKGFNPTKNVNLYFQENAEFTTWNAVSAHSQGDKEFSTTSAFGGIASKTVTPGSTNGTASIAAPTTPTDSTTPSGYTAM
ncbi:MAG TPA: hypothetical protein VHO68_08515, partial [Bacteroidales bacterium]|nr:hypothetical protein [Bacteroidales bacterium]